MTVKTFLQKFKNESIPKVSAAAAIGVYPATIDAWIKKDGLIPERWAYMVSTKFGIPINEKDYR